jgi:mannose-6-phosphate isomerase-like protein (cupin superfamily)
MSESIIHTNIERDTLNNNDFRHVISTSHEMQVVLMSLLPNEDIGMEVHPHATQFFRVEKGQGVVHIDYGKSLREIPIREGSMVFVPAGSQHNIINTSWFERLQLYTIYAPPQHPPNKVDHTKPIHD